MKMSSCKQTGYDVMERNDDVIIVNVFLCWLELYYVLHACVSYRDAY